MSFPSKGCPDQAQIDKEDADFLENQRIAAEGGSPVSRPAVAPPAPSPFSLGGFPWEIVPIFVIIGLALLVKFWPF